MKIGKLKMSQALPFLKIVAEQNGIKLNRPRYFKIACKIVEQSTQLN